LDVVLKHPWFQGNPTVKPATAVVAPPTEPTKLPLDSDIIKKETTKLFLNLPLLIKPKCRVMSDNLASLKRRLSKPSNKPH
jgi:hypothetical protein